MDNNLYNKKADIASMPFQKLSEFIVGMGEAGFRAKQIYNWLHIRNADSFDKMTDLSLNLREKLNESAYIPSVKILKKYEASADNTAKYLFSMEKGTIIESVLMRYDFGNSVCVSSQSGCRMGCAFCHSTKDGLERNLNAYEMLKQIYEIGEDIKERISNVVIMGSGEPLDNFDNVIDFINILTDEKGLDMGRRHVTLSTCGLVPFIYKLAEMDLGINLAVSLHASNDSVRQSIMPAAKAYSMDSLIKACDMFAQTTKRRVTYEYALIKGVNDGEKNALELGSRLSGRLCHVNLIPLNDVPDKKFFKPVRNTILRFEERLKKSGIAVTVRRELGSDINAACGQLKSAYTAADMR